MRPVRPVLTKLATVIFVLAAAPFAHAVPTQYTITNEALTDNGSGDPSGTISGFFEWDPDSNTFSAGISLSTTTGLAPFATMGTNYVDAECPTPAAGVLGCADSITSRTIVLAWSGTGNAFIFNETSGPSEASGSRTGAGVAGTVIAAPVTGAPAAVPEPGTVALMLTGLAGLGYRRLRQGNVGPQTKA